MNLLDKKLFPLGSGLVFLLIPFFFACDDPANLGIRVDSENQNISVRDTTIALPLSTVLIDSLRTNQFSTLLIGNSEDSVTGLVSCTGYTQYGPTRSTFPGDSLQFVSAHIRFKINEVRTTNYLLSGHIDVHQSGDTLYNQAIYLANREIDYDPTPIAQVDYSIDIEKDSVLNIPADDLGEELFDRLLRYDTDSAFRDSLELNLLYFRPLVLNTTSMNSGLMGLSLSNDSSGIWVEMKSPSSDSTYFYQFNFNGRGHFSNIKRNRDGSKLASLSQEYMDEVTGPYAYGSMIDGTYAKVDLSPLQGFYENFPNLIVNNARINLNTTDYSSEFIVPFRTIRFYFIRSGRINGPIGSSTFAAVRSTILTDAGYNSSGVSYLNLNHSADPPNYSGEVTQFTQLYADDAFGIDFSELIVLNPSTTSLLKSIYTSADITIYYTVIR